MQAKILKGKENKRKDLDSSVNPQKSEVKMRKKNVVTGCQLIIDKMVAESHLLLCQWKSGDLHYNS